jgi:hypothetical protein
VVERLLARRNGELLQRETVVAAMQPQVERTMCVVVSLTENSGVAHPGSISVSVKASSRACLVTRVLSSTTIEVPQKAALPTSLEVFEVSKLDSALSNLNNEMNLKDVPCGHEMSTKSVFQSSAFK